MHLKIAIIALLLSLGAQLMVPQMIQNILDAIVNGVALQQMAALPMDQQQALLNQLGLTPEQAQQMAAGPLRAIFWAIGLILVFAVMRGAFAFTQAFMGQTLSQNVAYDLRNELFAKIQRLSFSYHDRNRTGQLMVRATDDVDKLQMFLGQGLLLALQAVLLLTGALLMLVLTNWQLTLVILPILPIALGLFMVFGMVTQPLFGQVQARLSTLNTVLQENLAGIRVIKAFVRENPEHVRFDDAAEALMRQQIKAVSYTHLTLPTS